MTSYELGPVFFIFLRLNYFDTEEEDQAQEQKKSLSLFLGSLHSIFEVLVFRFCIFWRSSLFLVHLHLVGIYIIGVVFFEVIRDTKDIRDKQGYLRYK